MAGVWWWDNAPLTGYRVGRNVGAEPRRWATLFCASDENMKASIPVEWLSVESFNFYAQACGALLSGSMPALAMRPPLRVTSQSLRCSTTRWFSGLKLTATRPNRTTPGLVQAIKTGKVKAIQGV